ncbi:MAG: peptidylprolyl isomerase [Clostridia bacterium]|nr:peptidylprolyl isomerase [Clostridia bacterium]
MVTIEVKDFGTMELELYPEKAPATVENFVSLARSGFYDGLTFHRIIPGFMIQGGDPEGTGMGGSDKNIPGEFAANGFRKNDVKHVRGVISMARASDPDSASSQFFIMHEDAPHLDGSYAAFGKVTKGIEVVDKIASVRTDFRDRPAQKIVIEKITISG